MDIWKKLENTKKHDYSLPHYGYELGQVVKTKAELWTENHEYIPAGSLVRLVSFAPKVFMYPRDKRNDKKPIFFNAVKAEQVSEYGNRIRANFCTIEVK